MEGVIAEGGCFCGAVRYRGKLRTSQVHCCHCSDCRRSTGAPFLAWTNFNADEFEFTIGSPGCYESRNDAGARACRRFCSACGTHMTYQRPDELVSGRRAGVMGGDVWVTVGSLDEPGKMKGGGEHIWTASRLDLLRLESGMPEHEKGFPDD